jgi:hypothetical protein
MAAAALHAQPATEPLEKQQAGDCALMRPASTVRLETELGVANTWIGPCTNGIADGHGVFFTHRKDRAATWRFASYSYAYLGEFKALGAGGRYYSVQDAAGTRLMSVVGRDVPIAAADLPPWASFVLGKAPAPTPAERKTAADFVARPAVFPQPPALALSDNQCKALLREQYWTYTSVHGGNTRFFHLRTSKESCPQCGAVATRLQHAVDIAVPPPIPGSRYRPGCVGFRRDIAGSIEGAQCIARMLGTEFYLGQCSTDGYPYTIAP